METRVESHNLVSMNANDDEENDYDAAEALAYLNRIALRYLPNREEESKECWLTGCLNGPPYHDPFRREAYQALLLESFHTTEGKGVHQLLSGKRDKDRIKWDSQY